MKIIDAHMHYFNVDGFKEVAANAGYENTAACWQQICEAGSRFAKKTTLFSALLWAIRKMCPAVSAASALG